MIPSGIKALILDMDGVLWRDTVPIGDLAAVFASIQEKGLNVSLATNNASKTVEEYLDKLAKFGVFLEERQILTSSLATASVMEKEFPRGGPVFLIGENGIQRALEAHGFFPFSDAKEEIKPVAVVAGIDRYLSYQKLRHATLFIRAGVPFYGTNPDKSFPTPQGQVPGAGAILAALETASDAKAIVIGKPNPSMMFLAIERMGIEPEETLVIGDRLETDIAAGQRAGCKTALVLSGVTTREQAQKWKPTPDMVAETLTELVG